MALTVIAKNGFVYIADETGKKIATVLGNNAEKWDYAYRLAAAPEMLAALKAAVSPIDVYLGATGHVTGIEPQRRALAAAGNAIEDAIAKVEGHANG